MVNFYFELLHSASLWRRYLLHLLLLPLMLAITLVLLLFGFALHQQAMAPLPIAVSADASKLWSLGLQDNNSQTTAFDPAQIRQLTEVIPPDIQLAKLAFNMVDINDSVQGAQSLSALFVDTNLAELWPNAGFIQQLEADKVLLSHRLAKQWLAKNGTLPELLEIDGLYFQVGGLAPVQWPGIAHWQADLWFTASAHTALLQQRLKQQYQSLLSTSADLSILLPSLLDISPQFYLLAKQVTTPTDSQQKLAKVLQQINWSDNRKTEIGQLSVKITQRPLHAMLLPGVQFLPGQYKKIRNVSYLLLAQATLLFVLSALQLTILLLSRHLQRQQEWRIRFMLGLPRIQNWYALIAELLPVTALTILFYPITFVTLSGLFNHHQLFSAAFKPDQMQFGLQSSLLMLLGLLVAFGCLVILLRILTHYLSTFSNVNIFQVTTQLQKAGSVIMLIGACFALSICLLNWQTLQQLIQNNSISSQQQTMSILSLQKAPMRYYSAFAADLRTRGLQVSAITSAPLQPISEFYQFTLSGSAQDAIEFGVVKADLAAPSILDLELIAGRWFHEFAFNECVISQQGMRLLDKSPAEVLQRQLLNDLPVVGNCEIVGIVSDVHYGYLGKQIPAIVYKPLSGVTSQLYLISQAEKSSITALFNQFNSHPQAGIAEQWQLDELILLQSEQEWSFFRLTLVLMLCATLLFLASLYIEQALLQKRLGKEAAIRVALGGNTYSILRFLLKEPVQTIFIGTLILSLLLGITLLFIPLFKISISLIIGNLILILLCLVTVITLLRRLRKNQIKRLLQD